MAAISATHSSSPWKGGTIHRWSGTGTANQADTLSSTVVPERSAQRIVYVAVNYSASPTYTGTALTVKIDSGLGAAFDLQVGTGTNNGQNFVYSPDEEIFLLTGDAVIVAAPAGGSGITASVVIVTETY